MSEACTRPRWRMEMWKGRMRTLLKVRGKIVNISWAVL